MITIIILQYCHSYLVLFEYQLLKSPVFRCPVFRWLLYYTISKRIPDPSYIQIRPVISTFKINLLICPISLPLFAVSMRISQPDQRDSTPDVMASYFNYIGDGVSVSSLKTKLLGLTSSVCLKKNSAQSWFKQVPIQ